MFVGNVVLMVWWIPTYFAKVGREAILPERERHVFAVRRLSQLSALSDDPLGHSSMRHGWAGSRYAVPTLWGHSHDTLRYLYGAAGGEMRHDEFMHS